MIFIPILHAVHISNNDVLIAKILDSIAAILVVKLNLEVLVTIEIHEIVDPIGPFIIVRIVLLDLVRPPGNLLLDRLGFSHYLPEILMHEVREVTLLTLALLFLFLLRSQSGHFDLRE